MRLSRLKILLFFVWLTESWVLSPYSLASQETADDKVKSDDIDICNEISWLDRAYCHLLYGMDDNANKINDWFTPEPNNNSNSEVKRARTSGKIRLGWEPRQGDISELDLRFRVKVRLPALEKRVDLIFADQEESINEQDLKAARPPTSNIEEDAVVALQFRKKDNDRLAYRIGAGRSAQLYTRARYSSSLNLNDESVIYYYGEVNYYTRDKLGVEFNANYVQRITKRSGLEFNNTFRYRSVSDDWLWRHQVQYIVSGNKQSSYLFNAVIDGLSQPNYRKEKILVSARYKFKGFRDWMFFEVEPFILWLRKEDFKASWGLALRTEVRFATH